MMKYIISILLLLPLNLLAQFSVQSSKSFDYGKDASIDSIDAIVILEVLDATTNLVFEFADSTQSEWHYHTSTKDSLINSSINNDTITFLDSLKQGLYELRISPTSSYYYSVVDYSEYQGMLDSVWVDDSGDSCNTIRLYASLFRQDIPIYDKLTDSTYLLKAPENTEYIWSSMLEASKSPSRIDAPYEDIIYACIPYSDNFFPSNDSVVLYTDPDTLYADPYTAIAVSMGKFEASIPDDIGNSNETVTSSPTEGSAPLDVTYTVNPEGANDFTAWWLWNKDNSQPTAPTYRYQDQITHTFLKYAPNGYQVLVMVGNDYCQVSDSMEVKITESNMEAPNILVLGFGASGKFKVAYQSIDPSTFKAAIYDRKGRLIYKWYDPKGGWDGRSPVTNTYVSPGAYYYSIQAEGTDGEKYELMGDVNVIREKGI